MAGPSAQSKADERRQRNLASANASRARRREQISALTQEKARLNEANALLRARLQISDAATLPALTPLPPSSSRVKRDTVELGPAMQQLVRRKEMDGKAIVDLLDRAISGARGKGPPLDPEAAARLAEAARRAPKDTNRPFQHINPPGKGRGNGKGASSKKRKE